MTAQEVGKCVEWFLEGRLEFQNWYVREHSPHKWVPVTELDIPWLKASDFLSFRCRPGVNKPREWWLVNWQGVILGEWGDEATAHKMKEHTSDEVVHVREVLP